MTVIKSQLNTRSDEFRANAAAMQALVDDLRAKTSGSVARFDGEAQA